VEIRALLFAMGRNKSGPLLVAAQVALTLAVIVNVAYVIEQRLQDAGKPTGLDLGNMFWVSTQASSTDYNYPTAVKADLAYLNSLPGVVAATVVSVLPQTFSSDDLPFAADPKELETPEGGVEGTLYSGTDKLIDALGLKLIAGRNFAPDVVQQPATDSRATFARWAPEVLVTRAMAKKLFPDGQALGKTVYTGLINKSAVIIGIVDLMRANPMPAQYDPLNTQIVFLPIIPGGPDADYVIRVAPGRRDELMARIDKEFADLQPGRFISRMEAYDHTAFKARASYRASIIILGIAAFFVLLVTVIGMVGLATFNVTSRTKQLGTRRAIGARKFHILRYFLAENWLTTTAGVVLGCLLAVAAGMRVSSMFQMPRLPLYYLVAGVLLLWIVGLISVLVPAGRAAAVPPATATRTV
jgi:putative ABC transport system permease protein